jgi:2-keto-3-deoxy-L-rhamnonate aldolase RhmA
MIQRIKMKLACGEPVIAVNVGGNPDVVEMLGRYGTDMAFIDCERTGLGLNTATQLIRAARASGLPSVVRSWSREPEV